MQGKYVQWGRYLMVVVEVITYVIKASSFYLHYK